MNQLNSCIFSDNRKYRYVLERVLTEGGQVDRLAVIMCNPSLANEVRSDPTCARVFKRALQEDYNVITILNLFALISRHPKVLAEAANPVGVENNHYIAKTLDSQPDVLVAWGPYGRFLRREQTVLNMVYERHLNVFCLGLTSGGFPRHPLHVPYAQRFEPYRGRFSAFDVDYNQPAKL